MRVSVNKNGDEDSDSGDDDRMMRRTVDVCLFLVSFFIVVSLCLLPWALFLTFLLVVIIYVSSFVFFLSFFF